MRILFIAHSFPYPLHEGVKLHVYHLLKELSKNHAIDLITFIEREEEHQYLPQIQPFCQTIRTVIHRVPKQPWKRLWNMMFQADPFFVHQFTSDPMADMIREAVRQRPPDVVHIDYLSMAQYAALVARFPKVFFPHDAVSMMFERNAPRERNPLFRAFMASQAKKVRAYEEKVLPWFERTVVVSPVDRDVLLQRSPRSVVEWNPNGVDTEYFRPQPGREKPHRIIFRGIMSFLPNYDAALFFAQDVMPRVWEKLPTAEFWIVGWNAPNEFQALAVQEPRIRVTGFVDDIRNPMAEAVVIVCPMRIGSGIKNKILESFAMGKAVVATPLSLAGIDAVPGRHCATGESAEELATQTIGLLQDASRRAALGQEGRRLVEEHYSWTKHAAKFEKIYQEAVAAPRTSLPKGSYGAV